MSFNYYSINGSSFNENSFNVNYFLSPNFTETRKEASKVTIPMSHVMTYSTLHAAQKKGLISRSVAQSLATHKWTRYSQLPPPCSELPVPPTGSLKSEKESKKRKAKEDSETLPPPPAKRVKLENFQEDQPKTHVVEELKTENLNVDFMDQDRIDVKSFSKRCEEILRDAEKMKVEDLIDKMIIMKPFKPSCRKSPRAIARNWGALREIVLKSLLTDMEDKSIKTIIPLVGKLNTLNFNQLAFNQIVAKVGRTVKFLFETDPSDCMEFFIEIMLGAKQELQDPSLIKETLLAYNDKVPFERLVTSLFIFSYYLRADLTFVESFKKLIMDQKHIDSIHLLDLVWIFAKNGSQDINFFNHLLNSIREIHIKDYIDYIRNRCKKTSLNQPISRAHVIPYLDTYFQDLPNSNWHAFKQRMGLEYKMKL